MSDSSGLDGPLLARLRMARARAHAMHDATDVLNLAFRRVEKALGTLNLGVPVTVRLNAAYAGYGDEYRELSFCKLASDWQLVVIIDNDEVRPLISCSRDTRALAANKLPELIDALIEAVDQKVDAISVGTSQVNAIAEQIEALVEDGS